MDSMTSVSVEERQKYERMWEFEQYRGDHVTAYAREAIARMGMRRGDSVIDFGAGAGYASVHLQEAGLRVLAIEIARNALASDIAARVPYLIGSLWEMPVDVVADWGFCCDVMEHIPTAHVDEVLAFIARSVRRSSFMSISLRADGCGRLIGQPLHLTVQPADWWIRTLSKHWKACDVLPEERTDVLRAVVR
jgi:2-polyprenyl-3-methyl-5-hydroxy-6-metoxy-1,4-benzoquinol methylase